MGNHHSQQAFGLLAISQHLVQLTVVRSVTACRVCSSELRTAHILDEGADVKSDLQLHS